MKKILIIGIGSILRGDDGIGPRAIDALEKENLDASIVLERGDLSGLDLLKFFPDFDRIIIIDAADMGEKVGTVKTFGPEEIEDSTFDDKFSTHGMALLETLTLAKKLNLKADITIVGIQPENTKFDLELSDLIRSKIPCVTETVRTLVSKNK